LKPHKRNVAHKLQRYMRLKVDKRNVADPQWNRIARGKQLRRYTWLGRSKDWKHNIRCL